MEGTAALTFKIASEPWEFGQVHRLNYRTFVEEIPQHGANDGRVLVDRFHDENVYLICLRERELVGMMALRCVRPFSLDEKLGGDLERYLPAGRHRIAEIRLLAADKEHRGGRIFFGLMAASGKYLMRNGIDLAVISGTTRQLKLYRHMGFVPFGPLVGTPGAMFQPMYLTRERFEETERAFERSLSGAAGVGADRPVVSGMAPVSFLPGPVDVTAATHRAFASAPVSHRSDPFLSDFRQTRAALCRLTNARDVQILSGSGTLANDVVAARLSVEGGRGLVLSNGEFGDRLLDHARRAGLDFAALRLPWGGVFEAAEVESAIDADGGVQWVWAVHCETSSGVLNDLGALKALCARRGLRLCLDCISSIGTVPVDLAGVHLASGISGKGLRGYPGLSLVFHDRPVAAAPDRLPRYLDLGFYVAKSGVPFTVCSNHLYALKSAVEQLGSGGERFAEIARHCEHVRRSLGELGLEVVAPAAHGSPAVVTIVLSPEVSAVRVGDALAAAGFLLSYRSDYLLERNWVQVCLMGQYARATVDRMLALLGRLACGGEAEGAAEPAMAGLKV